MNTSDDLDRTEFISTIQTDLDRFKAEFVGVNPDWEPLYKVLPPEWWDGWMFMQLIGDIRLYKHGITRRYLNIDSQGKCYMHKGKHKGWVEIDTTLAVDAAYHGIEKLGETRASKYNDQYRARKYAAMAALGITVVK